MAQFGFVGPAYTAANPGQDNQALINWFVEHDANEPNPQSPEQNVAEAKVALGLLGVPGLSALNSAYSGEVRGIWVLPGGSQAVAVIGATVVRVTGSRGAITCTAVGTMSSSAGRVCIRDNGAGGICIIVDGTSTLYVYNVGAITLNSFNDPAYAGATSVAEIDGWFIFNNPNTQKFFTSPNYWNGLTPFDATYFALKDNSADNLVTVYENNRELWLVGESTTEPWYNAGGTTFPFGRIEGALMQVGCAAAKTVVRTGKGLMWLARSERGGCFVLMTQGYQYDEVSTPAIAYALNQYSTVSDAVAHIYTEEGHEFYVLTFPSADVTWVYDLKTAVWHQRASFDPNTGLFHRQRVSVRANFQGMELAGDYTNGRLYWQSRQFYADDQFPLVALRRSPHVWDKNDRNRVVNSRLQIDFFPGVGLSAGQGSNPLAVLRWSNDGGQTWAASRSTSIGLAGQTKNRAIWRRLGAARDRVYEVSISDPVKRDVAGASIQVGATQA